MNKRISINEKGNYRAKGSLYFYHERPRNDHSMGKRKQGQYLNAWLPRVLNTSFASPLFTGAAVIQLVKYASSPKPSVYCRQNAVRPHFFLKKLSAAVHSHYVLSTSLLVISPS